MYSSEESIINGEIVKNENILILNDTFFVSDLLIY